MTSWEYKSETIGQVSVWGEVAIDDAILTALGGSGWELVTAVRGDVPGPEIVSLDRFASVIGVFKRAVPETKP